MAVWVRMFINERIVINECTSYVPGFHWCWDPHWPCSGYQGQCASVRSFHPQIYCRRLISLQFLVSNGRATKGEKFARSYTRQYCPKQIWILPIMLCNNMTDLVSIHEAYRCGWWNHLPGTWIQEWHGGKMIQRIRIPSRLFVECREHARSRFILDEIKSMLLHVRQENTYDEDRRQLHRRRCAAKMTLLVSRHHISCGM